MVDDTHRRHVGCIRQRRHQAAKRAERVLLETAVAQLQKELDHLHLSRRSGSTDRKPPIDRNPFAMATRVLLKQLHALRDEAEARHRLMCLLHHWVASQLRPQAAPTTSSWYAMDATLLADPVARRLGYAWLSERIVWSARTRLVPASDVGDRRTMELHVRDNNNTGEVDVAGLEGHGQYTILANFKHVARTYWQLEKDAAAGVDGLDIVHDHLFFYPRVNPTIRSKLCTVLSLVHEERRCIMATVSVVMDECYPVAAGELRVHGCTWTVYEHVTDSITLVREAYFHMFTPNQPDATVAQLGRAFGIEVDASTFHREALIHRMRGVVESFATLSVPPPPQIQHLVQEADALDVNEIPCPPIE
ncbi:Aste57867_1467 [Aphanomyces stellatus]|uniref:Aste57867_1467 protein n=1 Tax=Aphanomyces stellatus TaxID=120398 RepID=A0A485KAE1_9STRA|nr:hypothetical protein As57867_001466 [Aphanomyces stellatus]VFT78683.1 Aste57867_1467 [Aphanomyces stellatus]